MCLLRSRRKHFDVSYFYPVALLRATVLNLVNRYYDICQTTDPAYLPAAIKIPWGYYPQCKSTLAGTDCTDLGFGLPAVNASLLYSTLLPNGTATLSNQGGMLTSPPYGSTTAWYFLGSTGPATTATAAAYTAGKQGAQCSQLPRRGPKTRKMPSLGGPSPRGRGRILKNYPIRKGHPNVWCSRKMC
jgi:hypothetical protein